jgi:hypothetical protein
MGAWNRVGVQKFGLANTGKETGVVKQEEKSAKSLMTTLASGSKWHLSYGWYMRS